VLGERGDLRQSRNVSQRSSWGSTMRNRRGALSGRENIWEEGTEQKNLGDLEGNVRPPKEVISHGI